MQTSQGCGTRHLLQCTPVLLSCEVDGSSSMQDAPSHGLPNFNPRLRSLLQKLSTLPCLSPFVMSFLSWGYYRKWGSKTSMSCVPSPTCTVRSSKTILAPLRWQSFLSFALGPSTLMWATIIFANMCARDSSKSSLLGTKNQIADALTKPVAQNNFQRHRCFMCGKWPSKHPKWGSVTYVVLWYLFLPYLPTYGIQNQSCLLEQNVLVWLNWKCYFKREIAIFRSD